MFLLYLSPSLSRESTLMHSLVATIPNADFPIHNSAPKDSNPFEDMQQMTRCMCKIRRQ